MFPKAGIWHHAPHGAAARPAPGRHRARSPRLLPPGAAPTCSGTLRDPPGPRTLLLTPGARGSGGHDAAGSSCVAPCGSITCVMPRGPQVPITAQPKQSKVCDTPRARCHLPWGHFRAVTGMAEDLGWAGALLAPCCPTKARGPLPHALQLFLSGTEGLVFRAQLPSLWKHGNDIPTRRADLIMPVTHRN